VTLNINSMAGTLRLELHLHVVGIGCFFRLLCKILETSIGAEHGKVLSP
jgi:hypothetical protein